MTRVRDLMSSPALSCRLSDPANRAAQIMWEHGCGCVPVVDGLGHVVGIVTDRDVCMGAYTQGRALFDVPVSSVCSRHVYAIAPDDSVREARALMELHRVRRLPVIDGDGTLVGVLSLADLARHRKPAAPTKERDTEAVSTVVEAVSRWRHPREHAHPDAGRHMKPNS